jgi:hypothetical protein
VQQRRGALHPRIDLGLRRPRNSSAKDMLS